MSNLQYRLMTTDRTVPLSGASSLVPLILPIWTTFERLTVKSPHRAAQVSVFFDLPSEIRLAIYHAILVDNNDSIAILKTCRQTHMEAREVLYHRTATFDSQSKLFKWISSSAARNLNRVRTITLRLTDVDLDSLLEDPNCRRRTRVTIWSLYRNDLQRLEQSLSALPKLSRLTVVPPKVGHSQLLKNMYHSFLAEIPKRCPRLRELEICDSDSLLETVPVLKDIRQVTFTDSGTNATVKPDRDRKEPRTQCNTDSVKVGTKRSRPLDETSSREPGRKKPV